MTTPAEDYSDFVEVFPTDLPAVAANCGQAKGVYTYDLETERDTVFQTIQTDNKSAEDNALADFLSHFQRNQVEGTEG